VARVFVALKLRLLRNRLSTGSLVSALGFLVVWLSSLAGGLVGGGLVAAVARLAPDSLAATVVLVHVAAGFLWLLIPIVLASLDDALDARSFETYPLDDRQIAGGLVIAGLAGPGAAATAVAFFYGGLLAFGSPAAVIPVLVEETVAVLLCVVVARWVTTRLSDLLRRRRGQEVAVLVVVGLASLPGILGVTVAPSFGSGVEFSAVLDRLAGVAQWTPWGALGRSVVATGTGAWGTAAAFFLYGAASAAVAFVLFSRALHRLSVVAPTAPVARVGRAGSSLLPRRLPLPRSPVGAVAAKELISMRRDVRMRSQLVGGGIAVVALGAAGGTVVLGTRYAPFLAVLTVFIVVNAVTPNQLGYEGGSFWAYLTIAPDLGSVIRGKNLAWAVVTAPLAAVTALATAAVSGEWVYVPAAVEGSVVVGLIWLGVGDITCVYGAFRLPETNLFGSRNLSGGAFVATLLGIAASGLLTAPPLLAVGVLALLAGPGWATLAATISVPYAVGVYRHMSRRAGELATRRRFRLLGVLDAG